MEEIFIKRIKIQFFYQLNISSFLNSNVIRSWQTHNIYNIILID